MMCFDTSAKASVPYTLYLIPIPNIWKQYLYFLGLMEQQPGTNL